MRITLLILALLSISFSSFSQCPPDRYYSEVFTSFEDSMDVLYGNSIDVGGTANDLYLDFYAPEGDTLSERPLVILAFGGFFLIGSKRDGDVDEMCKLYTKRGFACACIDYRTGISGFFPDSLDMTSALIRGVQDGKAAVRWFKEHYATGNDFRIDTTEIYFGGSSAGGFIGTHMAYLDDPTEAPTWVNALLTAEGGIEGNSGTPGRSSQFKGVLAYAGALKDVDWITSSTDELLWMSHAEGDATVPFGDGWVTYLASDIIQVQGSKSMFTKAQGLGLPSSLITFPGANHPPQLFDAPARELTAEMSSYFMYEHMDCFIPTNITETNQQEVTINVSPQPADRQLNVQLLQLGGAYWVQLYDMLGRPVYQEQYPEGKKPSLDVSSFPAGHYILSISKEKDGQMIGRKQVLIQ